MPGTAPTNDILNWFRVQRLLAFAQKVGETFPAIARGGSYGESVMELLTDKQHKVADEGSYYMTRSPTVGTGLATIAAQNSFADTSPFLIVTNGNPLGGATRLNSAMARPSLKESMWRSCASGCPSYVRHRL